MKNFIQAIRRNWLIIVFIIVTVAVFSLFIIPGFGLGKPRIKMVDTAITIKKIRQINKLIAAEYYGEITADLKEVYENIEETFKRLKNGGEDLTASDSLAIDILIDLLSEDELSEAIESKSWDDITKMAKYKTVVTRESKQLVYIGRGWVKAGFNLLDTALTIHQNSIDSGLTVILPQVEILYSDINPWFSEENEIEGFEIFIGKKQKQIKPFEVKAVKHLCKMKLIEDAKSKGLLRKAEKSGVNTISKLLDLLGCKVEKIRIVEVSQ